MAKPWYFQVMGTEVGPLTSSELMEKVQIGQIQPDTLVRSGKDGKWVAADRWKGLLTAKSEKSESAADSSTTSSATASASGTADTVPIVDEDDPLYHMKGEAAAGGPVPFTHPDEYDFFQFVGFRHAITHPLYDAMVIYSHQHQLTVTQITRRAVAKFIGKPELGQDKPPSGPEAEKSEQAKSEPEEDEIKLAD